MSAVGVTSNNERASSRPPFLAVIDPKPPSLLTLAKLQNKASVLHRSFARKIRLFFNTFGLERNS
jgi:hypothetical protein